MESVPIIDLGDYYGGDADKRAALAATVDRTCREIGFLVVTGHGIAGSRFDELFALARDFYDLPVEEKLRCVPPPGTILRGYAPMATQNLARSRGDTVPPDLRESFLMGRPGLTGREHAEEPEANAFYQPCIWPERPAGFHAAYAAYFADMERLARDLMRVFALALGVEETWFDDKIDDHFAILNTIHYPALSAPPEAGQLRAGAHSDFGSLTILAQTAAAGGLEVQRTDGTWIHVPPRPGCLVVNIGDLMAQWTNDRWRSTLHRVANPPGTGADRRQSIGFFCHPNYDAVIECIPTCRGEDAPRYAPVRAGTYMRRKIQAVRGAEDAPKAAE